jgi:membrane dipeptidase
MQDRSRAVHDQAIIVDALQISNWGEIVFRNMRQGGLTAVNCTVSVLENFRQTIANIIEWDHWLNEYSDLIMPVRSTADILAAKKAGKTGIIFGFQNTTAIEEDIGLLSIFHALGVRVIQLTYMEANLVGQGCLERIDAGLTRFGLEVVEEMNRLGILIDLSHVGYRTTLDAIEASAKPVAFTHANPHSLCSHARNKPARCHRNGLHRRPTRGIL